MNYSPVQTQQTNEKEYFSSTMVLHIWVPGTLLHTQSKRKYVENKRNILNLIVLNYKNWRVPSSAAITTKVTVLRQMLILNSILFDIRFFFMKIKKWSLKNKNWNGTKKIRIFKSLCFHKLNSYFRKIEKKLW